MGGGGGGERKREGEKERGDNMKYFGGKMSETGQILKVMKRRHAS